MKLYGGFTGTETQSAQRYWPQNITILSGDLNGDDHSSFANNSDNSYHVVTANGADANAFLDGFTISGGNANGGWPDNQGAGIFIRSGSPTLNNLIISGDLPSNLGGGIFMNGQARLTNITISNNAAAYGAGMVSASNPWLFGGRFSANNTASMYGGGLYNYNNSGPNLFNSLFYGNTANRGAGVYNDAGNPRLLHATFWHNTASTAGSGMYSTNNSSPFIQNSIFWGDIEAGDPEGEIRNDTVSGTNIASISHSLISGCSPNGV